MKSIAVALAVVLLTTQISHAAPNAIEKSALPEWAVSLVRNVSFLSSYFTSTFEDDSRNATATRAQAVKKQSLAPQVSDHRAQSAKIAQIGVTLYDERPASASAAQKAQAMSAQLASQRR